MGTDRKVPWCCWPECENGAVFDIVGESGSPDDNTQACAAHVGELLGTPRGVKRDNHNWYVSLSATGAESNTTN